MVYRKEYENPSEYNILTKKQFDNFMTVEESKEDRAMYSILYWCGTRIGECAGLSVGDYSIKDKTLHIHTNYDFKNRILTSTKTNKDRIVDIPNSCILEIEYLLIDYSKTSIKNYNLLPLIGFTNRIAYTTMRRNHVEYIKQANEYISTHEDQELLPQFTLHDLRHTHVSTLIDLGLEAKDIADRLGHSVEMVNNTYGHLFPQRKKIILDNLNNL